MAYYTTPLEDRVKHIYKYLDITHPSEINKDYIASLLNFEIYYLDMKSAVIKEFGQYHMAINQNLPPEGQWQDFGHEMGHMLYTAGKQMGLDNFTISLQEAKAENFGLQFCAPTFMLLQYDLANLYGDGIEFVSSTFCVTRAFARRRLAHFKRQMQLSQHDDELKKKLNHYEKSNNPDKWTDETRRVMDQLYHQVAEKKGDYYVKS